MRKQYNGFNTFSLKSNRHRIVSDRISCKQPVFSDTSESLIKYDEDAKKKGIRKSLRIATGKTKSNWPSNCNTCSSCSEKENNSKSSNWSSSNVNKGASQSSEDSLFAFKPKEAKPKKKGGKSTNRRQKRNIPQKSNTEKQRLSSPPKENIINFSEFDSYSLNIETYDPNPKANISTDYRSSPVQSNVSLSQKRPDLESVSSTLTCSTPVNDRTLFKTEQEEEEEEVNLSIIEYDEEEIYRGEVFEDPVINVSKSVSKSVNDQKIEIANNSQSKNKSGSLSSKISNNSSKTSDNSSKFMSCSLAKESNSSEQLRSALKDYSKTVNNKESVSTSSSYNSAQVESNFSANKRLNNENSVCILDSDKQSGSLNDCGRLEITENHAEKNDFSTSELSIFGSSPAPNYDSSQDLFCTPPEEMQTGRKSNDELTESEYKIKAYYESFNQNYIAKLKQKRLTENIASPPTRSIGSIYGIRESEISLPSETNADAQSTNDSQIVIGIENIDISKSPTMPFNDIENYRTDNNSSEKSIAEMQIEPKPRIEPPRKISERFHRLTMQCTPRKNSLTLHEVFSPIQNIDGKEITEKEKLLICCEQDEVATFEKCMTKRMLKECVKLGEGVYGEVFMAPRGKSKSAIKVIPIGGDFVINGELPKSFTDICAEIIISRELSDLDNISEISSTPGFCKLKKASVVQGPYPEQFLHQWFEFSDNNGTENDCPEDFPEDQHYVVLEYEESGKTLESKIFKDAWQIYSIFEQTVLSLAVAEDRLEFEHRDLHWGNVLVKDERKKTLQFRLNEQDIVIQSRGIKVTIIDYTMSRLTQDGKNVYTDISTDEELFTGEGDLQFDIYRMMRDHNENEWEWFRPKTNVYWLYYLSDKLCRHSRYERTLDDEGIQIINKLKDIHKNILDCRSAEDVYNKFFHCC